MAKLDGELGCSQSFKVLTRVQLGSVKVYYGERRSRNELHGSLGSAAQKLRHVTGFGPAFYIVWAIDEKPD
jgi:hypothetical protein